MCHPVWGTWETTANKIEEDLVEGCTGEGDRQW